MERPRPTLRGGAVLQVARYGSAGQFAEVWVINPYTLEERVIAVHAATHLPRPYDFVCWKPGQGVEWFPRGYAGKGLSLSRIGASFDPMQRTPRTA